VTRAEQFGSSRGRSWEETTSTFALLVRLENMTPKRT